MADEVVDVLLGGVVGASGYAGPFGGGEIALEVVQHESEHLRLSLVDWNTGGALSESALAEDDVQGYLATVEGAFQAANEP